MPFKQGESRPENAGRKKGTPNKITTDIKQFYLDILNHVKMEGLEGAATVFSKNDRNKITFYQIISKMLPTNMTVDGNLDLTYIVSDKFLPKGKKNGNVKS